MTPCAGKEVKKKEKTPPKSQQRRDQNTHVIHSHHLARHGGVHIRRSLDRLHRRRRVAERQENPRTHRSEGATTHKYGTHHSRVDALALKFVVNVRQPNVHDVPKFALGVVCTFEVTHHRHRPVNNGTQGV